jgi:hypothetical protein
MTTKKVIGATLVLAGLTLLAVGAVGAILHTLGSVTIGNPALTP